MTRVNIYTCELPCAIYSLFGGGGGEAETFQEYDVREWCDREGNAGSRVDLMTFQTID